jgi:mRNA interferase MazF
VLVAYSGDYGKVRPAVIVQADEVTDEVDSVLVALLTTSLRDADYLRLTVEPSATNGLREVSQLMADKIGILPKSAVRGHVGRLAPEQLDAFGQMLVLVLGLQVG